MPDRDCKMRSVHIGIIFENPRIMALRSRSKNDLPIYLIAIVFFVGLASCTGQKETTSWKLVWQDEFETNGSPNPENWEFSGRNKSDWNRYCADNPETTFIKDGKLHLRGIITKEATDTTRLLP